MSSRQAIIFITWEEITYATEENSPRHFAMHLPFATAEPIFKTPTIASVFHGEELSVTRRGLTQYHKRSRLN